MKRSQIVAVALSMIFLFGQEFASAQDTPPEEQQVVVVPLEQDRGPDDALNRGTPRGTAVGFLAACEEQNFEKAAEYLDLRSLPDEVADIGGRELARRLYLVIARAFWLDDYTLSENPEGVQGDGLPAYRDEFFPLTTPDGREYRLWLQRVPRGDGAMIWKVSNRSVALIPELYAEFSYPPLIEALREWFPEKGSFLGLELFKWFILLIAGVISWPVFWVLGWILGRLFSSPEKDAYPLVRKFFRGPFIMLGYLVVVGLLLKELGVGAYAREVLEAKTVTIIVVVWLLWSLINLFRAHKQRKLEDAGRPGAAKLLRPMTGLVKLVILVFALLFWLNNLGINITTLLAGLGVGGLAVALALQKPLEDMMGALTIFTQGTIRVGDFCRYGEVFGTVEDIGLRTTRLRTLGNTVVSVPNSRIAYVEVENLTSRMMIRYWPTLRLRYDTRPEQIREICERILDMLGADDRIHDEPLRARFTDFDADAVLVKVHSFVKTREYNTYLEVAESLNFKILDIVEACGARFALPGRSLYVEGDAPSTQT